MTIDEKQIRKISGFRVKCVKRCASAFDELADDIDVVIALSQKKGAGRGDHTFFSPAGGLYIVMREIGLNIDAHTLTPAVGLAVRDSIKAVLGLDARLKWVNDVYLGDKKVCGILCRSPRRGEYHIGIGVNYATDPEEFVKAGLPDAGTLAADESKATAFCTDLVRRIHLAALKTFDCERYNALCLTVGQQVNFVRDGVTITGLALGVESDGALIVRNGLADVAVDSGEVSIVNPEQDTPKTKKSA